MTLLGRPKTKPIRLLAAALSLWVGGAICFVLFNRYRYGGEFDGITDLLFLALGVPVAVVAVVVGFTSLGKSGSIVVGAGITLIAGAIFGIRLYQQHLAQVARAEQMERTRQDRAALERRFGAECAAQHGGHYAYEICLISKESVREAERDR